MKTRRDSLAVAGCALFVMVTLLACKKSKDEEVVGEAPDIANPLASALNIPTQTTMEKDAKIGEEVEMQDYKLTVLSVKDCKPSPYMVATLKKNKAKLIGIEVLFEATSDKRFFATHGKITDSEGFAHNKLSFSGNCEPRYSTAALNKGEKAKGWITFEVPENISGLKYGFDHISYPTNQNVRVDLGR